MKSCYNNNSCDCANSNKYCKPCPPCNDENQCGNSSYAVGNSVDFNVDRCDSEIKADITVSYRDTVRIWGQIVDCQGNPVPYAYLKLVKRTRNGYVGVAHTIADCLGFYQFDICPCEDTGNFRILVGKASIGGRERIVSRGLEGTNCNPCDTNNVPPCEC